MSSAAIWTGTILLSFLVVDVRSIHVEPDAVTGSAVRQLTAQEIEKVLAKQKIQMSPFSDDYASVKGTSGFKSFFLGDGQEVCPGEEYRIMCPGQRTKNHIPHRPVCVSEEQLCDSVKDCPNGEDEENAICFFHNIRRSRNYDMEKGLKDIIDFSVHLKKLTTKVAKHRKGQQMRHGHRHVRHNHKFRMLRKHFQEDDE